MLVNSDTFTANYGVKQSQFTKPTSESRASDPEEYNKAFDHAIRGWYCSITVANHQLITAIRFVSKIYTRSWKNFTNRLYLVLHASEILFSKNVREIYQ